MNNKLHIVAFDVPYPADYGGVIDIYHKIRWLHKLGVKVILHCYQYGRTPSTELNKICDKVYYYERSKYKNPFIGNIPYIVSTRSSNDLLKRLTADKHPILFEGLHTTFFIQSSELNNRLIAVRTHNIEHDYYKNLELVETNFFKKYFFRNESDNLRNYENVLKNAHHIIAISPSDYQYFNNQFGRASLIPAFHAYDSVAIKKNKGKYVLYHGNLSVGENNFAALYLVRNVFSKLSLPCIIAGNNPGKELRDAVSKFPNIKLVHDWDNKKIAEAISDAQVNVLPTFQATGIKLKLINALFIGKHCIVNKPMVENTGLESLCHIAEDDNEMINLIRKQYDLPFTQEQIDKRKEILETGVFGNQTNCKKLIQLLSL